MWIRAARFTFNKAVEYIKKEKVPLNIKLLRQKFVNLVEKKEGATSKKNQEELSEEEKIKILKREEEFNNLRLRHNVVPGDFLKKHHWLRRAPQVIRDNAIRDILKAYDSNTAKQVARRERGEKKNRFNIKFRYRVSLFCFNNPYPY